MKLLPPKDLADLPIQYTLGDRYRILRLEWWMGGLTALILSGMLLHYY